MQVWIPKKHCFVDKCREIVNKASEIEVSGMN